MIIIGHPTGNSNVRHAVMAMYEASLLREFWTSIAVTPGSVWDFAAHVPGMRSLSRREVSEKLVPYIRQRPFRECVRLLALRIGLENAVKRERSYASIDSVYRDLDQTMAASLSAGVHANVYCYEDGALETFRRARSFGRHCFYDLPIGYWRAAHEIFKEEADRLPGWRDTIPGLDDSREKLARKDEELALANHIMVASTFTAKTLKMVPFSCAEATIIRYGCDLGRSLLSAGAHQERKRSDALRVLFVGSLSQRKGLYELFRATESLGSRVKLTVIGRRVGACSERDTHLSRHRWIETAPHPEILREMREHDVLVFPSLFEGFGLVITEAIAQGIPVITTPNTAGPDILTDGVDGFVVPIRSWETIAERLERLDRDRDLLDAMKMRCRVTAGDLTWDIYRKKLSSAVAQHESL